MLKHRESIKKLFLLAILAVKDGNMNGETWTVSFPKPKLFKGDIYAWEERLLEEASGLVDEYGHHRMSDTPDDYIQMQLVNCIDGDEEVILWVVWDYTPPEEEVLHNAEDSGDEEVSQDDSDSPSSQK